MFAFFGQQILDYLHISLPALQCAGGLLLLLVALELLTGKEQEPTAAVGRNVALVPLGTPLLAGRARSWRRWCSPARSTTSPDFVAVALGVVLVHVCAVAGDAVLAADPAAASARAACCW